MADGKPPALSPATGVALSLVVSLVVAGIHYGASSARAEATQEAVRELKTRVDTGAAAQQAQAIELAAMRENVRAIRESTARIERAVESLAPTRGASRGTP